MPVSASEAIERSASHKVIARIMPFTFLIFVISWLDRANVSVAALTMSRELGLTSEAFGFAAGIFFIGYMICEIPSNVALRKFGARVWLARIQLTWGVVACGSALVQNAGQLYAARFLLGVAEAGLVPGLIAYYNYWFRMRQLAMTGAILGASVPAAFMISGPLSTWIMEHVQLFNLSGWRSMMIVEGLPALVTGGITYFFLTDRPEQAKWLTDDERRWLVDALGHEERGNPHLAHLKTWKVMTDPKVLHLGIIYLFYQFGSFGIGFWMPQLLKLISHNLTTMQVGLLSAIPYAFATVGLFIWSSSSDRTGERRLHALAALLLAGGGLAASALSHQLLPSILLLSLALTGFYAFKSPFNVLPRQFLSRDSAVVAFAVINSVGQIGAFAGPFVFGIIKAHTKGTLPGLFALSGFTLFSALLVFLLRVGPKPARPKEIVRQPGFQPALGDR